MRIELESKRGITLVALVITIIILLILAAISISSLTGENGLIKKSQDAKVQTEISKEKELINLSISGTQAKNLATRLERNSFKEELDANIGKDNKYTLIQIK